MASNRTRRDDEPTDPRLPADLTGIGNLQVLMFWELQYKKIYLEVRRTVNSPCVKKYMVYLDDEGKQSRVQKLIGNTWFVIPQSLFIVKSVDVPEHFELGNTFVCVRTDIRRRFDFLEGGAFIEKCSPNECSLIDYLDVMWS